MDVLRVPHRCPIAIISGSARRGSAAGSAFVAYLAVIDYSNQLGEDSSWEPDRKSWGRRLDIRCTEEE